MKLDDYRESDNVDDERDRATAGGGMGGGFGLGGGPGGRRMSLGQAAVVLALIGVGYLIKNSGALQSSAHPARDSAQEDHSKVFVSKVLATTEDAWSEKFRGWGRTYVPPTLVLFRDAVPSACGYESAAVGPFYCSRDRKAYLDLTFFDELRTQFGSPGDFAQAYVVAHEIGHHVQNLLGTSEMARHQGLTLGDSRGSVRLELQADCYAGMWGAWAQKKGLLEAGDVDEALHAARAIGDDTLQKRARGKVTPETFSHGTSAQRVRWFKTGMGAAGIQSCDTFSAKDL